MPSILYYGKTKKWSPFLPPSLTHKHTCAYARLPHTEEALSAIPTALPGSIFMQMSSGRAAYRSSQILK